MPTLTYRTARLIVLGFGAALISAVALSAFLQGADPVEAGAVLLFLPILVALAYGNHIGGLVAATVVSALYLGVRFNTLGDLDATEFIGVALVRVLLYVGLGVFGGWANAMLEHSLKKLELYDEIDDATGVGNARALLSIADREAARAERYGSVFSLALLQVDRPAFDDVDERTAIKGLRRLCQSVESSVRTTDLVARIPLAGREDIAVVLPETGREGAQQFTDRLVISAREHLSASGIPVNGEVQGHVVSLPGDEERLRAYQIEVIAALDYEVLRDAEGKA